MSSYWWLLDVPLALLVGYFLINFVWKFTAATGGVWARLLAAGDQSAVIVWNRLVVICSGLAGGLVVVADYFNAPGVSDGIKAAIQPQYVLILAILVPLISEFARRRKSSQQPVGGMGQQVSNPNVGTAGTNP